MGLARYALRRDFFRRATLTKSPIAALQLAPTKNRDPQDHQPAQKPFGPIVMKAEFSFFFSFLRNTHVKYVALPVGLLHGVHISQNILEPRAI